MTSWAPPATRSGADESDEPSSHSLENEAFGSSRESHHCTLVAVEQGAVKSDALSHKQEEEAHGEEQTDRDHRPDGNAPEHDRVD